MITVWVVLDEGLVRSAVMATLGRRNGDFEVSLAEELPGPVEAGCRTPAGVVITDQRRSGGEIFGVRRGDQRPARLVRVEVDRLDHALTSLHLGARGLFTDQTSGASLVDAVRQLAADRMWLAPELVRPMVADYLPLQRRRTLAREQLQALSAREVQLMVLIAAGLTNAQIAAELHLAVSTVKDYVGHTLTRLGLTRPEAIAVAVRADLARLPKANHAARSLLTTRPGGPGSPASATP